MTFVIFHLDFYHFFFKYESITLTYSNTKINLAMKIINAIILIVLLTPASLYAHAGHGHFENDGILHYLTSQEHVIPAISAGVLLLGLIFFLKNKKGIDVKAKEKDNA